MRMPVFSNEKLLEMLQKFTPGDIYSIAPKHYIIRGFDYYRQGRLLKFEWSPDGSELDASVKGNNFYHVKIRGQGSKPSFICSCPAWSYHSNCKHVVCAMMTMMNLLDPGSFKVEDSSETVRQRLLLELYGEQTMPAATAGRAEAAMPEPQEYSLIIHKGSRINEIYIRLNNSRLKQYPRNCPYELRQFVHPMHSTLHMSRFLDFEYFLKRFGNKYPVILETASGEVRIRFDEERYYSTCTEFDAYPDHVRISRICLHDDRKIRPEDVSDGFVFDLENGTFSLITDISGWQLWYEWGDMLFENGSYDDLPDPDKMTFSMPIEMFCMPQLILPSPDGEAPDDILIKTEGKSVVILTPEASYRIMITGVPDTDLFDLRAECLIEGVAQSPVYKLFRFLCSEWNGLSSSMRVQKRRKALYQAFFDILTAETKTVAEGIIKKTLSTGDFSKYKLKREAREVFKALQSIFGLEESRLVLHNGSWVSADVSKQKELSLYRVPYEIFGWEIFKEMQQHDTMSVPGEALSMNLSLLHERLQEEGIELYYEHKPVRTTAWDFSFEAVRPSGMDWFEIRPEIRCDGKLIDEQMWQKIVAGGGMSEQEDCVRILDAGSKKVLSIISEICSDNKGDKKTRKEVMQVPRLRLLDWVMLRGSGVKIKLPPEDEEIISRLTTLEKIDIRPLPVKLKAKLRHYQKEGYSWLAFLYENRFGACLADDMGLGKTLQAISLLGGLKEGRISCSEGAKQHPHLVVLPPSLLFNWEHEISRFYPDLKMVFYTGTERTTLFEGFDVVLTTYGLIRRDIKKLKELSFNVIIFDEAQAVKNIFADVTGAVRQLKADFKLTMTGTPVENHVGEYYSIIDLAVPGLLGEYDEFSPLIRQEASPALDRIIRRTRPFVLRRTKEKILKELPPKTETDIYLDLTEKQKALYKRTVAEVKQTIDQVYSSKTGQQAQIIALTAILKLRQLCISPQLLSPDIKEPSPKTMFLIDSLKELIEEEHSALVFSQFTSFLDLLEHDLKKQNMDFLRLDGSTQVKKRKKLIESFQCGDGPPVFLLSLKAGGQGLNLTRASYVFHLDPWWNPAVENQASDRAHRIGQKKNVTITRILMRHTIEEKMMTLKKKKLELYNAVMGESATGKKGFSITKEDFNFLLNI